jgi:hypothetical protein
MYCVAVFEPDDTGLRRVLVRPIPEKAPLRLGAVDSSASRLYYVVYGAVPHVKAMTLSSGEVCLVGDGTLPAPSPAGGDLAYWSVYSSGGELQPELWVVTQDGRRVKLPSQIAPRQLCWSPDGAYLAVLGKEPPTRLRRPRESLLVIPLNAPENLANRSEAGEYYLGMGWRNQGSLVVIVGQVGEDAEEGFSLLLYDTVEGAFGPKMPLGGLPVSHGTVYVSDGGRYALWRSSSEQSREHLVVDLTDGSWTRVGFPEDVEASLSPTGMRIAATGSESGSLYSAWRESGGTVWRVARQSPYVNQ